MDRQHRSPGGEAAPALLSVENIVVRYGGMRAVDDVTFALARNQRLGIIGPNGAGKSTLLKVVAGDLKPAGGRVVLNARPLRAGVTWRRARRGVVRTRQELGLFPTMTVEENIRCGLDFAPRPSATGAGVDELVDLLGISKWRHSQVGGLPYGTRKLTELARALATQPSVLMLDEPVAGLNTAEKAEMVERLNRALGEIDVGLVLVEHDMTTVSAVCPDRVIAMVAGRIAAEASFQSVVEDEVVVEAYFGSRRRL